MPYRKYAKRYRRKRYPRRGLARKVNRLTKSVGMKERKFIDTQIVNTAMANTGTITQLTNIAQGLTDVTRIGNKITIVGLLLTYIQNSDISTNTRVMLVQDKQTNGAIYIAADLLQDATTQDIIVSPKNADFKRRFRVYLDKNHPFSVAGGATKFYKKFFKMNIPLRYDANVGDITDLQSSSLSLFVATETAGAAVVNTVFVRVYFIDS